MTMDVYAQLEQRVDRTHGTSFDRLLRQAAAPPLAANDAAKPQASSPVSAAG
jgi:hypothetical protein